MQMKNKIFDFILFKIQIERIWYVKLRVGMMEMDLVV